MVVIILTARWEVSLPESLCPKWPMTFSAQHRITRWALSPLGKRLNPQVECPIAGDRQDSFLSSHRTKAIKRPAQTASPLTPETTCKRFGEKGGRKQQPCLPLLLLQLLLPMCLRLGSANSGSKSRIKNYMQCRKYFTSTSSYTSKATLQKVFSFSFQYSEN